MIVVVDYDSGNLGSIINMLKRQGIEARPGRDPNTIAAAERLILPGVGAFDHGMRNLEQLGLIEPLHQRVRDEGVPILGMCLGGQLMTRGSEEGKRPGLGWVEADTVHLRTHLPAGARSPRYPHIGWNFVYPAREHALLADLPDPPRFYFVHTYKMVCADPADVLVRARYDEIVFTAGFAHKNVVGVQFHPEKSHKFGMTLLRHFASWTPA